MNEKETHRILLIDDNEAIHDDFRKSLNPLETTGQLNKMKATLFNEPPKAPKARPFNFEIDSAYQGQEGHQMVMCAVEVGRPYSLAFLDVRMPPGWDGIQTAAQLWQIDPHIQLVICTAFSDHNWHEILDQVGLRGDMLILKKPFDQSELLQMTHALILKRRQEMTWRARIAKLEKQLKG